MQPLALAMIFGAVPLDGRSDVLSGRRSAWSLLVLYGRRLWRWSSTDAQVAAYGRFEGVPSRADLERFFFLDDADKSLIGDRRGDHNRLGLMLQATTVRFVGLFLEDGVPGRRFWSRHASQWERLGRCPSAMLAWRMARD